MHFIINLYCYSLYYKSNIFKFPVNLPTILQVKMDQIFVGPHLMDHSLEASFSSGFGIETMPNRRAYLLLLSDVIISELDGRYLPLETYFNIERIIPATSLIL